MSDILSSGGTFVPEEDIKEIEISKEEKEAIKAAEREIRETTILLNSPAWQRAKDKFIAEIQEMKNILPEKVENQSSLEDIGLEYKVCMLAEKKLLSFINSVESLQEVKDE